jgi:hypothetical protein
MARERLKRRGRPVPALRWAAAGAAACLLLAVFLALPTTRRAIEAPAQMRTAVQEDLDDNGRVDILDAFALARELESPQAPRKQWDMNGDGAVDGADVDVIAMAAVSLGRRSVQ